MNFVINLLVNALAILITAYILPGVEVSNYWVAIVVAVVLGLINAVIRPIILVLTLPINILTLGLFTFVITALLILLASAIVPGFHVKNFGWALLFGIVLGLINWFFNTYLI